MRCLLVRCLLACLVVAAAVGCGEGKSNVKATPPCRPVGGGWEVCDLGTLGGEESAAVAVNNRGQVVGLADTNLAPRAGEKATVVSHVFLWENGKMRDLGSFGGALSEVYAINDAGQVVGSSQTSSGRSHAFLWENGKMRDLAPMTSACAINNRGQVVGRGGGESAFLWDNGKMRSVAPRASACAINDRGEVLGGGGQSAFVWKAGRTTTFGPLPGKDSVSPNALNNRGQVVGSSETFSTTNAFLWQDGRLTDLGRGEATTINDAGQVAGFGPKGAFLWQHGRRRDFVDSIQPVENPLTFDVTVALNGRGHVAGETSGEQASLWAGGRLRIMYGLGSRRTGDLSGVSAINDHDVMVGTSATESGGYHAVVWRRSSG